jgi:NAD(P)-dependent dehydrogenase (short-subunit alcohol dehydrogenase family)
MTTRYESAHQNPNGPGDRRPTAHQIIEDEQLRGKWSDKTILITGCSSGIGIETARALLETGATLYLTARDLNKAKSALGSILENNRVHLLELDLKSLASVRKCADAFLAESDRLNVLIANAGVMATPEGRTVDGFETQFGTNHLAHFLLIELLRPTLIKSSSADFKSRVVILSSGAHRVGGINFSNLTLEGEYHPWAAYGQSKTANLYTANELERRYGNQGLHAWSVHPGLIMTGLMQFLPEETLQGWGNDANVNKKLKSPEQGASTTVWAATVKALEGDGGKYLEECQIAKPTPAGQEQDLSQPGYAPHAYDEEKERLLWEKSLELVKPFLS